MSLAQKIAGIGYEWVGAPVIAALPGKLSVKVFEHVPDSLEQRTASGAAIHHIKVSSYYELGVGVAVSAVPLILPAFRLNPELTFLVSTACIIDYLGRIFKTNGFNPKPAGVGEGIPYLGRVVYTVMTSIIQNKPEKLRKL